MGKINLNAMKQARKEQEIETPVPEALEQAYANVWGKDKETVQYIELNHIVPFADQRGRTQPFKISEEKVSQIKLSASDIGIVTPLIVRKVGAEYQIISGHHRYIAAKELEMLTVPCVVRKISDDEAIKYVTECNIQRSRLLPTEYAEIYARYMEMRNDIDMTAQEIADKFAISKKSLYRYIKILDLTDDLKKMIDEDKLHTDTAEIFCGFSADEQDAVYEFVQQTGKKVTGSGTTTTATGTGVPKETLYGDLNLDGKVDLADAVMLNKTVIGTVTLKGQAAINANTFSDDKIDANDATTLLQFLVRYIDTLPVTK